MKTRLAFLIGLSVYLFRLPLFAEDPIRYGTCGDMRGQELIGFLREMGANAVMVDAGAREVEIEKAKVFVALAHQNGIQVRSWQYSRNWIHWNQEKTLLKYPYCFSGEYRLDFGEVIKQAASCGFDRVMVASDEPCWMKSHIGYEFGAWEKREQAIMEQAGPNKYPYSKTFEDNFKKKYKVPIVQDEADPNFRFFMQARYESVADAIGYWNKCAKEANPSCETTLLLGSLLCSDMRYDQGAAWDMIGHRSGVDRIGTDPYIILHNYRGDTDHWYVTETAAHLVGAGKKRKADVVLEISRLRDYERSLRPVEMYGAALSSVFHGARSIYYFRHELLMGTNPPYGKIADDPTRSRQDLKKTFALLKDIAPWVDDAHIPRKIAVLYSRAGEDMYQLLLKQGKSEFLHQSRSYGYRYSFLANWGVLNTLFKNGYPFEMYFIEQLSYDDIKDFKLLILPFPLAVSPDKAKILEKAVKGGASLLAISEYGSLDELGGPNKTASLLNLLGIESVARREESQPLKFEKDSPILAGVNFANAPFSVYADVKLQSSARWLTRAPDGPSTPLRTGQGQGVALNEVKGQGKTVFLAGEFGIKSPPVPVLFSYAGDFDRLMDCTVTDAPWDRIAIFEKDEASVEADLALSPLIKQYKMYMVYKGGKEAKATDRFQITLNDKPIKEIPLKPDNWENTNNREIVFTPENAPAQRLKITLRGAPGAAVHKMFFTPQMTAAEKERELAPADNRYSAVLLNALDYLLGEEKPLVLRKKGLQDVEATVLDGKNGEKIILVINWEDIAVKAGVGIRLPAGAYVIEERNLEGMRAFSVGGKKVFSGEELKDLALELKPQEVRIFRIRRDQSEKQ